MVIIDELIHQTIRLIERPPLYDNCKSLSSGLLTNSRLRFMNASGFTEKNKEIV